MEQTLTDKAILVAVGQHLGQYRKNSNLPYIVHPLEVLKKISAWGITDDEILAAAILHDVIEDCEASYDDILKEFGKRVADIVLECSRADDHESKQQKYDFLLSFKTKSLESVIIKVADRIVNCGDYAREDKGDQYYLKYALQAYPLFSRYFDESKTIFETMLGSPAIDLMMHEVDFISNEIKAKYDIDIYEENLFDEVQKLVV